MLSVTVVNITDARGLIVKIKAHRCVVIISTYLTLVDRGTILVQNLYVSACRLLNAPKTNSLVIHLFLQPAELNPSVAPRVSPRSRSLCSQKPLGLFLASRQKTLRNILTFNSSKLHLKCLDFPQWEKKKLLSRSSLQKERENYSFLQPLPFTVSFQMDSFQSIHCSIFEINSLTLYDSHSTWCSNR